MAFCAQDRLGFFARRQMLSELIKAMKVSRLGRMGARSEHGSQDLSAIDACDVVHAIPRI